jgi:creatinine amidohydrolase
MKIIAFLILNIFGLACFAQKSGPGNKAIFLEDISWTKAREILNTESLIVIPLGAASKEHGPHLPLSTDFIQAEGIKNKLALERKVIIAPTVNYGFYPAFLKYAGSTSVTFATGTDMVLQLVRSLAGYGPRRFYIINIGVSTTPTLVSAASILADEGILLYFSRYDRPNFDNTEKNIRTQEFSGHADEMETSNILSLRSDLVDMSMAVDDSSIKNKTGVMTPIALEGGILNTSGINGYASLGTKEKGILSLNAFTKEVIREIDSISTAALPVAKNRTTEFRKYEGDYVNDKGIICSISQKDNRLHFIWNGRDQRNFFPLYRDADDYFTSLPMNILFIKDEAGVVTKAWCRFRGESFWLNKMKSKS